MEPQPLENDPKYVNTHHHRKRERWVKLITAFFVLLGTLATAVASIIGANTPKSITQQTNVGGDIIIGYQVIFQVLSQGKLRVPASKAEPPPIAFSLPTKRQEDTVQKKEPDSSDEFPVGVIPDASCYGLNQSLWSVSAEPVIRLAGTSSTGYNVNLRLHNLSSEATYVMYSGDTFLRDDAGNRLKLSAATIEMPHFGYAGAKVDPGAYYPVSLTFTGPLATGTKVGFDINLLLNPINPDGKPNGISNVMFGCSKMPVGTLPSSS